MVNPAKVQDLCHTLEKRAALDNKIDEYFKDGMHTDVNIICQNRIFKCHRQILAAASEYFHLMFCGNFSESHAQDVVLQDIDSITFEQILLLVYKGVDEIADINDDNVHNLLIASDFLRLNRIENFCIHYLTQKNIPIDCALEMYLFASALHKIALIPAISQFILQHIDHFSQEARFLNITLEDFSTLLAHFRGSSSVSQELKLVQAIFKWVYHSTDIHENRRSSFIELTQKVEFGFISSAYFVSEYFDRNSADSNDESYCDEISEALHWHSCTEKEYSNLHLYFDNSTGTSNILSRRENVSGVIDWDHSHSISPGIDWMRIVESDGRLYSFKKFGFQWIFSSSTTIDLSTNVQPLSLPSELVSMTQSELKEFYELSLCRCLRKNIYLGGLHEKVGFQCYHPELDLWTPITITSEYEPIDVIVSDDTRLYLIDRVWNKNHLSRSASTFAAYDPRVGKVEKLNGEGLVGHISVFQQPAIHHKGRIYVSKDDSLPYTTIHTFGMAIYDPCADRWDVQKLESHGFKYSGYSRQLVSFNNRLWMFSFDYGNLAKVYTHIYDSYLQLWNEDEYHAKLNEAISKEGHLGELISVLTF